MPFAINKYTADGSTTTFSVSFPYLSQGDLVVSVDGVVKTLTTDYTLPTSNQVTFNTAPTSGLIIEFRRSTSQSSRIVDYTAGAIFKESDLDTDGLQTFYMAQEALDIANDSPLSLNSANKFDAGGRILTNLADPVNNTDAVTLGFLTPNITSVNTVAGISGDVSTVAGLSATVTSVAGNATNINTVATNESSINTVAGDSSNINTVAGLSSEITSVVNNASNINAVAGNETNINLVAADATDINTVVSMSSDITAVIGNQANITAVAGNASNINAVNSNSSNINAAVSNETNINSVVSNASNINTVAGNITNINAVAADATDINTVVAMSGDITTVIGNQTNINTVANNNANINTVAGDSTSINAVANNATNINAVASNNTDISTVATSIADVNKYADTYFTGGTAPSSPSVGDLWFDTTVNVLKVYASGGWQTATAAISTSSSRLSYTVGTNSGAYTSGSLTTFPVSYDSGFIDVYLNGVKLVSSTDFTATNGNEVVLSTAATAGDVIDFVAYGNQILTDVNTLSPYASEIDTVATNISNVNTTATDISNVNTVATNIANINSIANPNPVLFKRCEEMIGYTSFANSTTINSEWVTTQTVSTSYSAAYLSPQATMTRAVTVVPGTKLNMWVDVYGTDYVNILVGTTSGGNNVYSNSLNADAWVSFTIPSGVTTIYVQIKNGSYSSYIRFAAIGLWDMEFDSDYAVRHVFLQKSSAYITPAHPVHYSVSLKDSNTKVLSPLYGGTAGTHFRPTTQAGFRNIEIIAEKP